MPLLSLALGAIAGACHGSGASSSLPTRSCALTMWYRPVSADDYVEVVGSWDGWARPGRALDVAQGGWRATRLDDLAPGPYQYVFVDDGQELADPTVPTTAFHGGEEVTLVDVPDCDAPAMRVDAVSATADGHASIDATMVSARSGAPVDAASVTVTPVHGAAPPAVQADADPTTGKVHVELAGLTPGKAVVSLGARDAAGVAAEAALATVWTEARAWDWRDAVIYEVMVDRYRARDGSALAQPDPPSGWAGGNVGGVEKAIESGELAALGVNTLWLTPLYANPEGTFPGGDGRPYSAYHGYWPTQSRALDPRLASEADVDALVAAAHARGMRVLFDVVPHHVHQEHPYFAAHKTDGWFQHVDGSCVCGVDACDWSTHLTDCWFTPYLPSFDWTDDDAAAAVTGDVLWWMQRFDGDGVRIDAVPMMPRAATRRIAAATRAALDDPTTHAYLVGENFVGSEGWDLLRYQLGPFGLGGEFDFPLMWALRGALAQGSGTMADVDAAVRTGEATWAGSGAVMGLIVDNHDTSRFVTVAAGDDTGDTWTPAPQPSDPLAYAKQEVALGAILTLPGAPVLYYGDEVALAGRGDPDSRRVMPAEAALTALQTATRDLARALGRARACSDALRRGTYRALAVGPEYLVFARESGVDAAVVVLQRATAGDLKVPLPGISAGTWVNVVSGASESLIPELTTLPGAPFSVAVLVPRTSPCAPGAH